MKVILFFVSINNTLQPTDSCNFPNGLPITEAIDDNSCPENNGWRKITIEDDKKELWIHHEESPPEDEQWEHLMNQLGNRVQEIYIALHYTSMRLNVRRVEEEAKKQFPNNIIYINTFSREYNDHIWRSFSDLLVLVKQENKKCDKLTQFDILCDFIKKKQIINDLSVLKHRVNRLFGSINNDLQELEERSKNGFGEFLDYWKDAYCAYKDVNWEDRFKELTRLVGEFLGSFGKKISDYRLLEGLLSENKIDEIKQIVNAIKENNAGNLYDEIKKQGAKPLLDWIKKLDEELDKTKEI